MPYLTHSTKSNMKCNTLELSSILLLFTYFRLISSYVVTEDQVTFYLRTRDTNDAIQVTNENFANINPNKKFNFIIHGWIASHSEEWVQNLTSAYLEKDDCNVIQVDWKTPAAQVEYVSSNNTKGVGYFVGQFINKLIDELKVNSQSVSIVGHSFGSHVSGFAGKQVQKVNAVKIGRITATDPARPPFESSLISSNDKLAKEDATTVVVIHTDIGKSGYVAPLGTIDFYPNGGGAPQPGCEDSENIDTCSHVIVNEFLTEAIENPEGFLSTKCDSYDEYLNGNCDDNEKVALGGSVENFQGVFYFQTNPQPPYSKN